MSNLDARLKDHFENIRLPDAKLEKLLLASEEAISTSDSERGTAGRTSRVLSSGNWQMAKTFNGWRSWVLSRTTGWRMTQASAAAVLVLVVAVFMHGNGTLAERRNHMVKEVAMNHGTRFDLEFSGESLAAIDQNMRLLPFSLALPGRLSGTVDVVGSRYCSLAGKLAAHVRFLDRETGKPMSLFVTGMIDDLEAMQPQNSELRGVEVELWREGGLFFALANQS